MAALSSSSESKPRYQPAKPPRESSGRFVRFISRLVGVLILIGVLVIATGVAPVSWITLERNGGQVKAKVGSCVFFVIPYHTRQIEPVMDIDTRNRAGSIPTTGGRPDPSRRADDLGYLVIESSAEALEVLVDPSSLPSVAEKAEQFLADPQAGKLRLFVVSNWTFSLVFSGLATALYGLIAGCYLYALGKWLLRKTGFRKARR